MIVDFHSHTLCSDGSLEPQALADMMAQRAVEAMGSGASLAWEMQLAAFALFRLFDAVKRGPVGWVDRKVGGGLGIMLDDLVAALLALLALGAGTFLWVCIDVWLHGLHLIL